MSENREHRALGLCERAEVPWCGLLGPGVNGADHVLACRLAERVCALPLASVVETMRPLPIEAVSGAPASVLGIAILRGAPVPVVDGRRLFGEPRREAGRWVSLRIGMRMVALAVDDVLGVRTIDRGSLAQMPPLLTHAADGAIDAIGAVDSELFFVLQAARLVPDELPGG